MTGVVLLAHTQVDFSALRELGYQPHDPEQWWADELAEFAGRNCYRSFNRPNPATEENRDYLAHILDIGHESVLEHASASFYVDTSRSVLTEMERHRHLSFSVVSQRYVDPVPLGIHRPPALELLPLGLQLEADEIIGASWSQDVADYRRLVEIFAEAGLPRKKSREAARSVLPNMTASPMVVTGNHRTWRYVIKARWHEAADAEIRAVVGEVLEQLRGIAPNTYQDIPSVPYSYSKSEVDLLQRIIELENDLAEKSEQIRQMEANQHPLLWINGEGTVDVVG